jgi:hypothetical protein
MNICILKTLRKNKKPGQLSCPGAQNGIRNILNPLNTSGTYMYHML